MKSLTKLALALSTTAMIGSMAAPAFAQPEAGDLLVRGRVIYVTPDESSTIGTIGGSAQVGNEITPELDFTYFMSENVGVELILATTKHSVSAADTALGDLDLGSVWLLPPTLTLQYHFTDMGALKPYVGAGINYTMFYNSNEGPVADKVSYKNKFGFALQAGADYEIGENLYFNIDLKKLFLKTDVTVDATTAASAVVPANVKLNPWIFGVGFGKKF